CGHAYPLIHYDRLNPVLPQELLNLLIVLFGKRLGGRITLYFEHLCEREKRSVNKDLSSLCRFPNGGTIVRSSRLLVNQADERARIPIDTLTQESLRVDG